MWHYPYLLPPPLLPPPPPTARDPRVTFSCDITTLLFSYFSSYSSSFPSISTTPTTTTTLYSTLYLLRTHIRTSTNPHNILRRSLSPGTSVAVISTTCSRAPFPFPLVGASSAFWFFSLPFFFFSSSLSSSSLGLFSHL